MRISGWSILISGVLPGLLFASPVLFRPAIAETTAYPVTTIYVTTCGNDIVEPGEFCDDGPDNRSYVAGTSEHFCSTDCLGWAPSCGDAITQSEFGEICDRNNTTCLDGAYSGQKSCNTTCNDWLNCHAYEFCGDGAKNGAEICDTSTRNCVSGGYSGSQSCLADCSGFDNCVISEACGDSTVNGDEICDENFRSCVTLHEYEGTQSCNNTCSGWNNCQSSESCGDGIINGDEECDGGSSCDSDCSLKTGGGGGGGGGGGSRMSEDIYYSSTRVVMQGKAYPSSSVTILRDGSIATVVKTDANANFKATLTNLPAGLSTFGLWSEDKYGNRSITFSFTVNVSADITTSINGIFLPPTISIDKTEVKKGDILNIMGQSAPNSKIDVTVNSPEPGITGTINADEYGSWSYSFNTWLLEYGSHNTKAKATDTTGALSGYSNTLAFIVGDTSSTCAKSADINRDNRVNLVDFSILLYNWSNLKNNKSDINCDSKASLVDFSIMMYQWTG